jgi:hypothetical protein
MAWRPSLTFSAAGLIRRVSSCQGGFYGPVILLNKVIQILILMDLDFLTGFFDERFDGRGIGPALINGDFFR